MRRSATFRPAHVAVRVLATDSTAEADEGAKRWAAFARRAIARGRDAATKPIPHAAQV